MEDPFKDMEMPEVPRPVGRAVLILSGGVQQFVTQTRAEILEAMLAPDALGFFEFDSYHDFQHTEDRIPYTMSLRPEVVVGVQEWNEQIGEAARRDKRAQDEDCLGKPEEGAEEGEVVGAVLLGTAEKPMPSMLEALGLDPESLARKEQEERERREREEGADG